MTVEKKAAGIGNDGARQDLAQRRLPGAVVADQTKDLASAQHEVDAIKGLDGAKGLADVLHLNPDRRGGAQHPLGLCFPAQEKERDAQASRSGRFKRAYLKRLRNLSTLSLVTMVTGMSILGSTFSPFLTLSTVSTPATPSWKGSC